MATEDRQVETAAEKDPSSLEQMQSNFLSNGSSGWVSKKFQVRWMGLEIQIDSSNQNVWCDQMQIMFDHVLIIVLHQAHPTIQSLEDGVLHRSAAH